MESVDLEKDIIGLKAKIGYVEKTVTSISGRLDNVENALKEVTTLGYKIGELNKNIDKLNARIDKIENEKEEIRKEKEKRLENNKNEAIMSAVRIIISAIVGGIIGKNYI